jgi:hypothetical protein
MPQLTPALKSLKRQFIVSPESIVDLVKPRPRNLLLEHFYCPYAPCCSQCEGIFTFREALHHLRRTHERGTVEIKEMVKDGLPLVPKKRRYVLGSTFQPRESGVSPALSTRWSSMMSFVRNRNYPESSE